jgi:hypothetical protein
MSFRGFEDIFRFKIHRINTICFFIFLVSFLQPGYSRTDDFDKKYIKFSLIYQTVKPLELNKAVLYYSSFRGQAKQDSIVFKYTEETKYTDSVIFIPSWRYPAYLKLKLSFNDMSRVSQIFQYSAQQETWEVFVKDSTLRVQPKLSNNNSNSQKSLRGLALIIQAAFEMVIALLIGRALGWPPLIIFMVLVGNIAAFPIYLINIKSLIIKEALVFFVKGLVMWLIGMRKLAFYKIAILAIVLYVLSFGLKTILLFIAQIL